MLLLIQLISKDLCIGMCSVFPMCVTCVGRLRLVVVQCCVCVFVCVTHNSRADIVHGICGFISE